METPFNAITEAIALMGGPVAAASLLGVRSYQVVQNWREIGVPAHHCPSVERAVHGRITVEQLRPDLKWYRIKDRTWPGGRGRPAWDITQPVTQPVAEAA